MQYKDFFQNETCCLKVLVCYNLTGGRVFYRTKISILTHVHMLFLLLPAWGTCIFTYAWSAEIRCMVP